MLRTPADLAREALFLRDFHRSQMTEQQDGLADLAEFTQGEPVFLVRCRQCRTLRRNPQPTPESVRERYRKDTYGRETLTAMLKNERPFFARKAAWLAGLVPPEAAVLEVGSFLGAFLHAWKAHGGAAEGVDIGEETVEFQKDQGLPVTLGTIEAVEVRPFDAVVVWNTFDQIDRPARFLDEVHRRLRPGGWLVLRVPNGEFLSWCHELGCDRARRALAWNNFLAFPYLCGYSTEGLRLLLAEAGFRMGALTPDVILPLSDDRYLASARRQEEAVKRGCLRAASLVRAATGREVAPWLDVVCRAVP